LSEAALRPSSATPYGDYISTLRLRSLRLEEERLLEIRRLQVGRQSYLVLYSSLRLVIKYFQILNLNGYSKFKWIFKI